MKKALVVLLFFHVTGLAMAQTDDTVLIKGAKIYTVTGDIIEDGSILIESGKIAAIGTDVRVPSGAEVIDAAGMVITPGLIDSHSHLGLGPSGGVTEDNEMSDPATPQLQVIDSIHPEGMAPHRRSFRDAVAEGVTTIIARPGSGNVIGGQAAALKLAGKTVDEMVLAFPVDMKMAMGKKGYYAAKGRLPVTRMGTAYIVRQAMIDAEQYRDSWKRYEEKMKAEPDTQPPKRDLKSEAMLKVLNREIPVHIHCSRVDDIMTAVRLAVEFDFLRLSLGHAEEAYKVADELARRGVKVIVGPLMITYDDDGNLVNLAADLVKRGVEISIMTDADVVQQEFLRYQAAVAVKYGLDFDEALKAITLNPAKLIGKEDRIGSLEVGKDADLVIFNGDPFDIQTKVIKTFINGKLVYSVDQG